MKSIIKKLLSLVFVFTFALVFISCKNSGVKVSLTSDLYELKAGMEMNLQTVVENSDSAYVYELSNPEVASIVKDSLIVSSDICEDTQFTVKVSLVSDPTITDTKTYTINAPKIDILNDDIKLTKGQKAQIEVSVTNVHNKSITWSVSKEDLVTISKTNELVVIGDVEFDTKVTITASLNYNPNIKVSKDIVILKAKQTDLVKPTNVKMSSDGLITWNKVDGATSYVVKINNNVKTAKQNSYQITSLYTDFDYCVAAVRDGEIGPYSDIYHYNAKNPYENVIVTITGGSEVKSGKQIKLTANVQNADDNTLVTWEIVKGSEFATIDANGVLSAKAVDGDKILEVKATSVANPEKYATKVITITQKQELTQAMLDKLNVNRIMFEGYLNISLYKFGISSSLVSTTTITLKTAMDGENWYSEYENSATGTMVGLYFKEHDGLASKVGVSFTNEEQFEPMLDDDGKAISFIDSGLYNNFIGLKVSDFAFNDETWRYDYVGSDEKLPAKMIASANPYDFKELGFSLIVEDGEVIGIYAKSDEDYTISDGYKAIQELIVAVNYGETVVVPTIAKYAHDPIHDKLNEAIENMKALDNYTLDFKEITASYITSGYVQDGFIEKITKEDCYFTPYRISYDNRGEEIKTLDETNCYGFHQFTSDLYNSYVMDTDGKFYATRAYATSVDKAKPSFDFVGEIFTSYYVDDENGEITYYVDKPMSSVASTFYYGLGNDINLYGIFATEGFVSSTESFTPYVVVKDGYITEAGFYFYLGSIYGVIELKYYDFNKTEIDVEIDFEKRLVPTSWSEVDIEVSLSEGTTEDDKTTNALEYLQEFYGFDNVDEKVPFFGNVLGDTYGFGLTTFHIPVGTNVAKSAVVFYYDVPLDIDYTIDSSLEKVYAYLEECGFTRNKNNEFEKDGVYIAPVDSSLDLLIYIWK